MAIVVGTVNHWRWTSCSESVRFCDRNKVNWMNYNTAFRHSLSFKYYSQLSISGNGNHAIICIYYKCSWQGLYTAKNLSQLVNKSTLLNRLYHLILIRQCEITSHVTLMTFYCISLYIPSPY